MIIKFQPRALIETLNAIRKKHPVLKGEDGVPAEVLLERVRLLLQNTPNEEIQNRARDFTPPQVKACLYLLDDKEVSSKALDILRFRARKDVFIQAWKLFVRTYPASKELQQLIKVLFNDMGPEVLVSEGVAPKYVSAWFKEDTIPAGIYADYRERDDKRIYDEYLFASGLQENDGLFSNAWRSLLMRGTAKDLFTQGGNRIHRELLKPTTGGVDRDNYGHHYLNTLKTLNYWYEPILAFIEKRYGRPARRNEHEAPFWTKIDEKVKSEYLKWYITRQIRDFFDGERADFWRQFVNTRRVLDVQRILSGRGFMLDFGTFGVVEFKDIGNAAYIYPKMVFNTFWNRAEDYYQPWQLKDRSKTISRIGSGGRIIHSPRGGWQQQAQNEIGRLL